MLYLWVRHVPDTDFEGSLIVDGFHGGCRCGRHVGFNDRYDRYSGRVPLILICSSDIVMLRISRCGVFCGVRENGCRD